MDRIKALWAEVQTWYSGLTARERKLVTLAGAGAVVFILFLVLYTSAMSASSTRNRTEQKLAKLREVQELATSFRDAQRQRQATERQLTGSGLQLVSYLEDVGTRSGITIPTMNPKGDVALGDGTIVESSVELTLTDITLDRLHRFLTTVENGPGVVKVKSLRIEPRPSSQTLTAWVNIATYRMKE